MACISSLDAKYPGGVLISTVLEAEKGSSHGAGCLVTCGTSDGYELAVPSHDGCWGEREHSGVFLHSSNPIVKPALVTLSNLGHSMKSLFSYRHITWLQLQHVHCQRVQFSP